MASLAPELKPAFCAEKQRLIGAYTQSVSMFLRVQSAQWQALIKGRGFEFDMEIAASRLAVERARAVIVAHQSEHGC